MAPRSPLYTGDYDRRAALIRANATANPATRCMEHCVCRALTWSTCACGQACGRTLAQHPSTGTGRLPRWSAGHAWDNDPTAPLRPSVLGCNVTERNDRINRRQPEYVEPW